MTWRVVAKSDGQALGTGNDNDLSLNVVSQKVLIISASVELT